MSHFDRMNPAFWGKVSRQILSYLRRQGRPVLVGEIALWIAMNLQDSSALLGELVERKLIRPALRAEILSGDQQGYAYVLANPQDVPMGDSDSIPDELIGGPPSRLV